MKNNGKVCDVCSLDYALEYLRKGLLLDNIIPEVTESPDERLS